MLYSVFQGFKHHKMAQIKHGISMDIELNDSCFDNEFVQFLYWKFETQLFKNPKCCCFTVLGNGHQPSKGVCSLFPF